MSSPVPFRRLAAITATMFVLILAFLAGRVNGGADPAQATTPAARSTPSAPPLPERELPDEQDSIPAPGGQDFDPPVTEAS